WPRWLADLLLVNTVMAIVANAYFAARDLPHIITAFPGLYALWHAFASLAVLLPLAWLGDYGRRVVSPRAVLLAVSVGFLAFFSVGFFLKEQAFSRIVFAATGVSGSLIVAGWRWLGGRGGRFFRRVMGGSKRVAILGTGPRAKALGGLIQGDSLEGYEW